MIDASEQIPATSTPRRRSSRASAASRSADARSPQPRRDFDEDFASPYPSAEEDFYGSARRPTPTQGSSRFRLRRGQLRVPKTLWGRIVTGVSIAAFLGCIVFSLMLIRSFFLHDPRFTLQSSTSIQILGNDHLSRAQVLEVFGEDIERNIFTVSLASRRASLEQIPWVEHATVMRLLPNHIRVSLTERTPVAFVRQGSQIGLVDATGVLLDMPPNAPGDPTYSFPVITGITQQDALSTRAARMKLYKGFADDLDSAGDKVSQKLSEVDLSNPEDIKALIPEGSSDILVHFGDTDFLARYQNFEQHLAEWRTQYPRLASVDMRYERQVVLEMPPGTASAASSDAKAANPATPKTDAAAKPDTKPGTAKAAAKPAKAAKKPTPKAAQKGKPAHAASTKPAAPFVPIMTPAHTVSTAKSAAKPTPQAAQQ